MLKLIGSSFVSLASRAPRAFGVLACFGVITGFVACGSGCAAQNASSNTATTVTTERKADLRYEDRKAATSNPTDLVIPTKSVNEDDPYAEDVEIDRAKLNGRPVIGAAPAPRSISLANRPDFGRIAALPRD